MAFNYFHHFFPEEEKKQSNWAFNYFHPIVMEVMEPNMEPELSKRKDIDKVNLKKKKSLRILNNFDEKFQRKANCECAKCKSQQAAKIKTETSPPKQTLLDLVMCRIQRYKFELKIIENNNWLFSPAGGEDYRA